MSQIVITVLKQGTKHPNILSCSFFTMQDAYRSFAKYQSQLKRFLDQVKGLDYEIRIYTDDTGKDFALKVAKEDNVTVLHYDCEPFHEDNGHVGTFGTLVRFLPLFEDHDSVWISDIDIPDHYLDDKFKGDIKISSNICYERKVYGRKHTILAGKFISRIQFPKVLLTNFIKKLLAGKFKSEVDALNAQNTRKPPSVFPYGVDELFLNSAVYDWIRKRDINLTVETDMLVTNMLTKNVKLPEKDEALLAEFYRHPRKQLMPRMKTLYKKWLPQLDYPCIKDLLDTLDSYDSNFIKKLFIKSSEL